MPTRAPMINVRTRKTCSSRSRKSAVHRCDDASLPVFPANSPALATLVFLFCLDFSVDSRATYGAAGVSASSFTSPPGRKNLRLKTCSRRRSSSRCLARAFSRSVREISPRNFREEGSTTGIRVIPFSAIRYTTARNGSFGNASTASLRTSSPSVRRKAASPSCSWVPAASHG